jgi:hypothetical protein
LTKTDDKKKDGEDTGSALDLAPRKAAGKKGGKGRDNGDAYQDRSESRRTGIDDDSNEFKAAEKLAEDFEARARAEGQDEETVSPPLKLSKYMLITLLRSPSNVNTSEATRHIPFS